MLQASINWAETQDEAEVAAVAQQEAEAHCSLQASWRAQPMWQACTPQQTHSSQRGQHQQLHSRHGGELPPPDDATSELVEYRGQLLHVRRRCRVAEAAHRVHKCVRRDGTAWQRGLLVLANCLPAGATAGK